ncbi:MAG: ArsI/CadI family heavy metal resistance metalloenzyme [Candidatus Sericytochromatia bacterium]
MTNSTISKMHVSLNVSNVENSIKFYETFFGEKVNKVRVGYANFDLQNPPLKLALNEIPFEKNEGALSHLGIQVYSKDEVKKGIERLKSSGLITLEENNTTCCYAVQDKVWVSDPDGNKWEIYVVTDELEKNYKQENLSGCCPEKSEKTEEKSCCSEKIESVEEKKVSKCCS